MELDGDFASVCFEVPARHHAVFIIPTKQQITLTTPYLQKMREKRERERVRNKEKRINSHILPAKWVDSPLL